MKQAFRSGLFLCYFVGLVAAVSVHHAQSNTAAEVIAAYTKNAREVHEWKMNALFEIQMLYTQSVDEEEKIEYENVFALPVEDNMYVEHDQLFCKTYARMEWKVELTPTAMKGHQTIETAQARFTASNPYLNEEDTEELKAMKPLPDLRFQFQTPAVGENAEATFLHIVLPPSLHQWHHPYSIWYPLPEHIGLPEDTSKIVMTQGDDLLYALMYTPTKLDEKLMDYLVHATQDSGLNESELVCTLLIDPISFTCKSFDIKLHEDRKHSLFSISSFSEAMAGTKTPIPTRSLMMTAVKNQTEDGVKWTMEYSRRFELKSFVRE